jgi:hypothetical protein
MNCTNCKAEVLLNFCPNCGHPSSVERIDGRYILKEIGSVLNFQRGILYTLKALTVHPGKSMRDYLTQHRTRLVKPTAFIIITSLFYSLCMAVFNFEDGYVGYVDDDGSTANNLFRWVQDNYGYSNLMMGVLIAFWTRLFFRRYPYNLFEILIMLCYVIGMGMFMLAIFGIVEGLTNLKVLQFGAILLFVYATWAIGQFFDGRKISSYLKALFAYLFGLIAFSLMLFAIGSFVDEVVMR